MSAAEEGRAGGAGEARGAPAIRRRRPEDVPVLVDLVLAQQSLTRYPVRDPLPFPVEELLHAADACEAWVAETDGRVVGHVCWVRSPDPTTAAATAGAAAHGAPASSLGWVSALVVAPAAGGRGVGRALLGTAVAAIRDAGAHPCLEVVDLNPTAGALYRSAGWVEVLRVRPDWLAGAVADPAVGESVMVLRAVDGGRVELGRSRRRGPDRLLPSVTAG